MNTRLTVLGQADRPTHLKVRCQCGVEKEVSKQNINSTKSCGCLRREHRERQKHRYKVINKTLNDWAYKTSTDKLQNSSLDNAHLINIRRYIKETA